MALRAAQLVTVRGAHLWPPPLLRQPLARPDTGTAPTVTPVDCANPAMVGAKCCGALADPASQRSVSMPDQAGQRALAGRSAAQARFRFDAAALDQLPACDFDSLEQVLDRWDDISHSQLESVLNRLLSPLVRRLKAGPS